jgi:hypothetical protein
VSQLGHGLVVLLVVDTVGQAEEEPVLPAVAEQVVEDRVVLDRIPVEPERLKYRETREGLLWSEPAPRLGTVWQTKKPPLA